MQPTIEFKVFAVVSTPGETAYDAPTESRGQSLGTITVPAYDDSYGLPTPILRPVGLMGDHLRKAGFDLPAFTLDRWLRFMPAGSVAICADGGFMSAPMVLWLEQI